MEVRRPTRIFGVAAGAIALIIAAYQAAGEAQDRRRYQPPGRLVDVGGRRLHIRCVGDGSPTVVIIPALGAYSAAWLEVQDALATHTKVCVYDRPGLGWSDPVAAWPSAAGMARDLHGLLEAPDIEPPFALAGHSMGGLEAVLTLRAVISNGDFDEYWRLHLAREHQRLCPGTAQGQYTFSA